MSITPSQKRNHEGKTKFKGSVSGEVLTSGTDEVIAMQDGAGNDVVVGGLSIVCTDALGIKLNEETNVHQFAAGDKFTFEGIDIRKITVVETAVTINYKGLHY